jgi:hypothetical protein
VITILFLLCIVAGVLAPDLPGWIDPYVLLLGFVATRVELSRMLLPLLFIAFMKGSASLDATWYHLVLASIGTLFLVALRRRFFAVRPFNQVWFTFVLGTIWQAGAVLPLLVAYPHSGRWPIVQQVLETAGITALLAPVFYVVVEHLLLRPERWRRGLLPATGA